MSKTEMRLDPLRQTWTLFCDARVSKPSLPGQRQNGETLSPFTAGHEQFLPQPLYIAKSGDQWIVRVVPNRAPALRVEGRAVSRPEGFYDCMDGVGAHEVIIETPDDQPLEALPLPHVSQVITAWKVRMLDLLRDSRLRAFFVVKNVGKAAGETFPHSVSQLLAMAAVPVSLRQKLDVARDFFERKRRSIFDDILTEEVRVGSRLVYENNGFSALCPYASRTPFELAIYPKRQCADFHGITDQETAQLSDVLKSSLLKLNGALDHPAYHLMLYTAPSRTPRRDHWNTLDRDFRWHIEIVPRLFPPNAIEMATGCFMNTVWPETAAQSLREVNV